MAHTYTRTVTVVPSSAEYSWDNPATGWITINQLGSSDTWEITVSDNQTSQARSATLTVNHADGTTTNSIDVNQAAGGSLSPTPVPPTATPVPPTATPIPPTATPAFVSIGVELDNYNQSSNDYNFSNGDVTVGYTLTNVPANISPAAPDEVSSAYVSTTVTNPTGSSPVSSKGESVPTIWTGNITFTQASSPLNGIAAALQLSHGGVTTGNDLFYYTIDSSVSEEDGDGPKVIG